MAQIFDDDVVRSDLRVPANSQGKILTQTIVQVENFLTEDELPDTIDFVLDERFRERALQTLLDRSSLGSSGVVLRDSANFISVDENSNTPVYLTALMKHRLYNPQSIRKIVDSTIRELI